MNYYRKQGAARLAFGFFVFFEERGGSVLNSYSYKQKQRDRLLLNFISGV